MEEYSKSAFVADVNKALEDAERASRQNQKDKGTLARDAYSKLQYDYPLVSQQELRALTEAVCSKEPWAVLSDRILTVLCDCVSRGSSKTGGVAPMASSTQQEPSTATATASPATEDLDADALLASFQKLYLLFILSTITEAVLQPTPEAASQVLSQLTLAAIISTAEEDPLFQSNLTSSMNFKEPFTHPNDSEMDSTARIIDVTHDVDENLIDDELYEPLEIPSLAPPSHLAAGAAASRKNNTNPPLNGAISISDSDSTSDVIAKVLYVSSKLSYHIASSPGVWHDGIVLSSLEKCLTALRQHPNFGQLLPAAGAVCSLLHDRCIHSVNPVEYDTAMIAVVRSLGLLDNTKISSSSGGKGGGGDKTSASIAAMLLGLETTASLSRRLPQGPSRRKLWSHIDEFWLKLAAGMLEENEAAWRLQKKKNNDNKSGGGDVSEIKRKAEDIHIISISSILTEFCIVEAPVVVKIEKIQEVLLSSGLFRSLVLSFISYGREAGLESLRRALLIACASSPGLLTWAKAVPGFSTAWEHPEFAIGGSLGRYGAVHAAVFGLPTGDEALASVLLLGKASSESTAITAEDVPEVYITLQLVESVQKARDRAGKGGKERAERLSFFSGVKTVAALESLSSSLRGLKVELDTIAGDNNKDNAFDESEQAEKAREEEKLAVSSEVQAGKLAARRAKLLQPECLRMIKGLLSKPGSVGKSD